MQVKCIFLFTSLIIAALFFYFERLTIMKYEDLYLAQPKDRNELSSLTQQARKYALLNILSTLSFSSFAIVTLYIATRIIADYR